MIKGLCLEKFELEESDKVYVLMGTITRENKPHMMDSFQCEETWKQVDEMSDKMA